ncbi:DUF3857 and transglutaminase domain-containing protein [candidate division KSB1 bacterium]|nr:DUF3857 and transglutaminase domain-containing protein [candidate division KSB1 bacterium]NIR73309.1 DUF3857 and transglutaminase domain-containing protein [candidate division KSB1 bacterium]NIS27015.1 DUF3857 and transglutaminase domain-containing protein [candidate division KSB1 bacterium]NIT73855.1 DUF3857 and transglutaminase domain-containing protein [candidate division KSB1 bacterium]NIU27760.1 DUF3857 and transglutaminase domain-containing protein [candidate division KSB1 bacterium]
MKRKIRILAVFILFVCACSAAGQDGLWHDEVDALVELDITEFEIHDEDKAIKRVQRIIYVYNEKGNHYANVSVFENTFSECKELYGEILDAEGRVVFETDNEDIRREHCGSEYIFYEDCQYQTVDLTWNSYPYTIKYEYEVKYSTLFYWPGWFPQKDVPVLHSSYLLKFKRPVQHNRLGIGLNADSLMTEEEPGKIFRWTLSNIEPRTTESYMPPEKRVQMALLFSPSYFKLDDYQGSFQSWQKFGAWYNYLTEDRTQLPQQAIAKIKALIEGIDDNDLRIQKLYEFLQNYTHYVAVELGIGGYQPYSAEEVYEKKYGDCKDLSNLMIAMLNEAGIDAYPALIQTRDKGVTITEFPSQQFNHAIVLVPMEEDTIWLECTADRLAAGELPASDEGCHVLLVNENGGQIVQTPISGPEENLWQSRIDARLTSTGKLFLTGKARATGNVANGLRNALAGLKGEKLKNKLRRTLASNLPNFSLSGYKFRNLDRDYHRPLELAFEGSVTNFATGAANRLLLNPNILSMKDTRAIPDETQRKFPVHHRYAYGLVDSLMLAVPPGYVLETGPESQNRHSAVGSYETNYSFEDNKFAYWRYYRLAKSQIPVEQYPEYREFVRAVAKTDSEMFVFKK